MLAAALLVIRSQTAHAIDMGRLQQQISAGRSKVSALSGVVGGYSGRLDRLNASIDKLQSRLTRLQNDLNAKRMQLFKVQVELTAARNRLKQLEAFQSHAESVLARQLINTFEMDRPDLVTVVLESTGFQDMLERLSFAQRIQKQDVQIVRQVRAARRAVAAQAVRLGALEVRQQQLVRQVQSERDALASTRMSLLRQRISVARARGVKAGQLARARSQLTSLQDQLARAQAAAAARAAAADRVQSTGSLASPATGLVPAPAGSSGGFVFPLPKGSASPPGSWSLDQGVDISAPGNTPEYAVCSGTIVLHGIGGFGPWAPVLHCDSPIDGYSYVYYGHAGPAYQLPVGAHVGAGQVMSSVGPGIVGISTGPHIEIGFADSSGSPMGGGATTMMSLLQGSY